MKALAALLLFCLSGCAATLVRTIPMLSADHEHFQIEHLYSVRDPQFERAVGTLLGPPIVPGNEVTTLINGVEIFPAMLDAIRGAEQSINFETYVYWDGDIGRQFAAALAERARSGVKVSVVIDWYGLSRIRGDFLKDLKEAGAEVMLYHEPRWFDPTRWRDLPDVDRRTHRKLLIVDGKTGFTGGVGIADVWQGDADGKDHWRDTHFRAVGPVVAQLQSAFIDNWLESGGALLHGDRYFPELPPRGEKKAQAFKGSAGEATASIELMYRLAISSAAATIRIASAYFVPDKGTIEALARAAKRGVRVEIIVPGQEIDQDVVRLASRAMWGDLLRAGVRIFEYQPTMFHCKTMIVDDYFVSVGSTNFDNRSFRLNDEVNLNVFDEAFGREQNAVFEEDKTKAQEITYEMWQNRGVLERMFNYFFVLFRKEM